jgi:hypothetical protein
MVCIEKLIERFELSTFRLLSERSATKLYEPMALPIGLEPMTFRLTAERSAD